MNKKSYEEIKAALGDDYDICEKIVFYLRDHQGGKDQCKHTWDVAEEFDLHYLEAERLMSKLDRVGLTVPNG